MMKLNLFLYKILHDYYVKFFFIHTSYISLEGGEEKNQIFQNIKKIVKNQY